MCLRSKRFPQVFSSTTLRNHQYFSAHPSLTSMHDYWKNHSIYYTNLFGKMISLLFNTLPRFVITILPRCKFSFSSVSQSCPTPATPWTAVSQAFLFITISQSLLKLMSTESVTPSNHLILCGLLFLLPSIFPSISVFSNESALCIR